MELNSLTDVLIEELGDLYRAEKQLVEALPNLAAAARSYELREALESHLKETTQHVERLDHAFAKMGIRFAPTTTCQAMKGLIEEGDAVIGATGDSVAIDAALIGAAQRIEHYEIGAYGTARALAGELHLDTTSALLDQTLDEEGRANKTLTKLASGGMLSSGINRIAAERSESEPVEEPDLTDRTDADNPVATCTQLAFPEHGRVKNDFIVYGGWSRMPAVAEESHFVQFNRGGLRCSRWPERVTG